MTKKQPAGIKAILEQLDQLAGKSPEFAQLMPEYARQLLDQFVKQSEHERQMDLHKNEMEKRAQEAQIKVLYLGQWLGFLIGMTAIISGAVIAGLGSQWAGGFIGGGGVIGLVSVFVLGRRKA